MKEATGELNMTVVTIVAVAAVGGLFVLLVWPMIQKAIAEQSCKTYGDTYHAYKKGTTTNTTGTDERAKVSKYECCTGPGKNCIDIDK